MQQIPDKSYFTIFVTNGGVEDFSDYWQEQCQQLYDSIVRLPEGKIKPLEKEGIKGNKAILETFFSTLIFIEITKKVFVDIIIPSLKAWNEFRPKAEIELKCPNGTSIKITNLPISKISKFFEENPQLSICEGLCSFNKVNE